MNVRTQFNQIFPTYIPDVSNTNELPAPLYNSYMQEYFKVNNRTIGLIPVQGDHVKHFALVTGKAFKNAQQMKLHIFKITQLNGAGAQLATPSQIQQLKNMA